MFFKISLSVVAVPVVVYMNIPEEPTILISESAKSVIKKEAVQVLLQQEEILPVKDENKSYIIPSMIDKFLPQNVYVGDKNESEIGASLQNKANAESLPSLQYSLHTLDYNALIPTRDIMDITQQKEVTQERSDSVLISPFTIKAP